MKIQFISYAAGVQLWMLSSMAAAATFVCSDDIDASAKHSEAANILWSQTLTYLQGVREILTENNGCNDGPLAVVETNDGGGNVARQCVTKYQDVQKAIKHLDSVLKEPDAARKCFDTQKHYDAFPLYSANDDIKAKSTVAAWLDRPTLVAFYQQKSGELKDAGLSLANDFWAILQQSKMPYYLKTDISVRQLPDLWAAVGWLPFYADSEKAHNVRFRGGYAYAEVMGPWGLLRIKTIDGEPVGAEIGMTVQLSDTFYPYHYHHPQEFYMPLTSASCGDEHLFFVAQEDSALFERHSRQDGFYIDADPSADLPAWFIPQSPNGNNFTYFERNAIHAFNVGKGCSNQPSGLVSVWGRTTARDNEQSTRLCEVVEKRSVARNAEPHSRYICNPTKWEY
ncbi:dimethylsulfonioproprionate lyase family protein [Aestuariibacter sp. A3R04]|uniref:dimethylsulfonioproprionate lyase family protein n=1 Tax=Aestuariibacter sp. A3R04 TaxID=2841571 RepID=UPI001C09A5D0|nr:hypothetical protein [Aestuariibacter sp. A3R04]